VSSNLTEGTTATSLLLLPLMASLPVSKDGGEVVSPPNIRTIRLRSTAHRTPELANFVRESRVHLLGFYCGG
jgi:hypothetical protein